MCQVGATLLLLWNIEDSTMASSRVKLSRCLFQCFHVCEFPLHGVWGNLAELWWEGLVWTRAGRFHRSQAPVLGSGRATRSRSKVIPRPRGGRGLPRPRQIPSPPGGPWTCADQTVSYNKFLNLINFMARICLLFPRRRMTQKEKEGLIVKVINRKF